MALYLYYGKIGDGKSYHVVKSEIMPAVRDGRKMYVYLDGLSSRRLSQVCGRNANITLWDRVEQVREACQVEVDDREGAGLKIERGALLVIDEAQLVWDAREWQKSGKQTMAFFEFHRHFGLDIVLITQAPGRLDKAVVRLANECLHVKNLRFLHSFMSNRYVVNVRQSPQDREPLATIRGRFDSEVFACYRSTSLRKSATVHGRGLRGVIVWGPALAALALVFFMRSGGFGIAHGRAAVVSSPLDVGSVRPPESWPKSTAELRRVDPPVVGITGDGQGPVGLAQVVSSTEPVRRFDDKKGGLSDEHPVIGVVEVDGVVRTFRRGDRLLSSAGSPGGTVFEGALRGE